jgi:hypothetical protein
MKRMQGNAKALLCFFHKGASMKWVLIAVLLVPGLAYGSGDDPDEPTTIEQCEAMNETLQALTVRLVKAGVQCQQGILNNKAAVDHLTPCGPCCERINGKPGEDPLSPGDLHFCLFPQSCAANREQQYCALTKWMAVRKSCKSHVVGYDDGPWAKADEAAYKSMYEGVRLKTDTLMNSMVEPLEKLKKRLHRKTFKKKIHFPQ